MLTRAATVVQQLCKSCRTCFKFYCMFYFSCDLSLKHRQTVNSPRTGIVNWLNPEDWRAEQKQRKVVEFVSLMSALTLHIWRSRRAFPQIPNRSFCNRSLFIAKYFNCTFIFARPQTPCVTFYYRPQMFAPTREFSGMADSMEPCKMLRGRPLRPWQRHLA